MFFYGSKASKMGTININGTTCMHCQDVTMQQVSVFGKYAHIYWIPFFPIGQEAVSECKFCKRTISQKEFPSQLKAKYDQQRSTVKRPFWHWMGLAIVGLLIVGFNIAGSTAEVDSRSELLNADLAQMTANPTMEMDSTSLKLKSFFTDFTNKEINPSEFEYLTKVSGDKLLILCKIPDLKKVEKDSRTQVIELIEMVADLDESLKDKEKYIGVHGKYNMMMVKTPTATKNGKLISASPLYAFYGEKVLAE